MMYVVPMFSGPGGPGALAASQTVNRTAVAAATYTLLADDYLLAVTYTATGAVTITLPTALCTAGRVIEIVDEGGSAGTNNITIATQGSETISGAANWVIDHDYNGVTLYSNGSHWFVK